MSSPSESPLGVVVSRSVSMRIELLALLLPAALLGLAAMTPRLTVARAEGVRHGDTTWTATLDSAFAKHRVEIRQVLEDHRVPRVASERR